MTFIFESLKGYFFRVFPGKKTVRISEDEYEKSSERRPRQRIPKIGDKIEIIVKPYARKRTIIGTVKRVLTRRKTHTRGHKVMLLDGTVGRTIRIL